MSLGHNWSRITLQGLSEGVFYETKKKVNENREEISEEISIVFLEKQTNKDDRKLRNEPPCFSECREIKEAEKEGALPFNFRSILEKITYSPPVKPKWIDINGDKYAKYKSRPLRWSSLEEIEAGLMSKRIYLDEYCINVIAFFLNTNKDVSEERRIEIAKLCVAINIYTTLKCIQNFGIESEEGRFEIAKLCIKKDFDRTFVIIQNFGIESEVGRFEIAKLCIEENVDRTDQCIQKFGIESEEKRIELAKLNVEKNLSNTVKHIQKFGIKNEEKRIELAKLCIEKDVYITLKNIQKFCIESQEKRIEIAELSAQKDVNATLVYFNYFGIKSEEDRIKIAKLCAKKNGHLTAKYIEKFDIKDKEALIEIAKLCATHNGYHGIGQFIRNFGIEDQNALIEIAKLCAQQYADNTAEFIKNFGIEDQNALIEIAELCANQQGNGIVQYIRNFGIQNEKARIKIAKICAFQDSQMVHFITNFNIFDKDAFLEIGMLCAKQNGERTLMCIDSFYHRGPELRELDCIFSLCVFSFPDNLRSRYDDVGLKKKLIPLIDPLEFMDKENPCLDDLKKIVLTCATSYIQESLDPNSSLLEQMPKYLEKINNIHALTQVSRWIASMLFFLSILTPTEQEQLIKAELFGNLLSIQSPILRQNLSYLLIQFALSPNAFKTYLDEQAAVDADLERNSQLMSGRQKKKQDKSNQLLEKKIEEAASLPKKQAQEKKILDFVLKGLQIAGVSKEATDNVKSIFSPIFAGKAEIRPLLEMLCLLNDSILLSAKQKEQVLQSLCEGAIKDPKEKRKDYDVRFRKLKPELKQRATALLTILIFKNEALLQNSSSIIECAKTTFQEKLHFDANDESFTTFQERFITERNPNALITYAAKLFSLNEPAVMEDLGRYILSVMNGTLSQERYNLHNNPHLQKVNTVAPGLLDKWRSPLERIDTTFSPEGEALFDPLLWLKNKVDHGHMAPNSFPNLDALLKNEPIDENSLSTIEKAFKKLLESSDNSSRILQLELIQQELLSLNACQFKNDVNDQLKLLKRQASSLQETVPVSIEETEDALDLLLCGTEVVGSCQSVHASGYTNKGLLGYMLDGKNHLMVVKDQRGQIIARAKLSILLDNEDKPALYLEDLYLQGRFTNQCLNAILLRAIDKAQSLGIPLTVAKGNYCSDLHLIQHEEFGNPLFSGVGPARYEYADACKGVREQGVYTIPANQISAVSRI